MVGIVPDTRYRDLREAGGSVYFPLAQSFFPFAPTTLAIRTDGQPAEFVQAIAARDTAKRHRECRSRARRRLKRYARDHSRSQGSTRLC